jgi:hypothetical protein
MSRFPFFTNILDFNMGNPDLAKYFPVINLVNGQAVIQLSVLPDDVHLFLTTSPLPSSSSLSPAECKILQGIILN